MTAKLDNGPASCADETLQRLADAYAAICARLDLIERVEGFALAPSFAVVGAPAGLDLYRLGLENGAAARLLIDHALAAAEAEKSEVYRLLTGPAFAVPPHVLAAYERAVNGAGQAEDAA
jgi:hypothetical protein